MQLEIITPEGKIFESSEVQVLTVPGEKGSFQILRNHTPITSLLTKGNVKIKISGGTPDAGVFKKNNDTGEFLLEIATGILENKDNKAVVLAQLA